MASTRIYRTMGSPTNDKIFTISGWFKLCKSSGHLLFASDANNNTSWTQLTFSSDRLNVSAYNTGWLVTNRVLRDRNAWYNIVLAFDSTQSTAADRIKLYINGVQETSFATDNRASTSQNQSWGWNKNGVVNNIGGENASGYGDFLLSHFHNIDGTAYDASAFGSTDATTGEWKINTSPSVTYGNNGFFWLRDSVATTDHSPNSNTFTIGGTLTKTEDCPDNVFATLNPLAKMSTSTLSHGNTTEAKSNGKGGVVSTLAVNSGKYYCEVKINTVGVDPQIGIYAVGGGSKGYPTSYLGNSYDQAPSMGWLVNAAYAIGYGASNSGNVGSAFTVGDIMMIALDMDNSKVWWGKNGTWFNSGDPANGTNAQFTNVNSDYHAFATGSNANNESGNYSFNFGNGYFGTTAISSEGTNASGVGKFEYDVPTNFTALSTKGLNL